MTEQPLPQGATITLLPPSANGTFPQLPPTPSPHKSGRTRTRISGMRTSLIADFAVLVVVMILVIHNAHAVSISFFGAHLRLTLAVALLLAAIAGALIMAVAGTARITQLRRIVSRPGSRHDLLYLRLAAGAYRHTMQASAPPGMGAR